MRLVYHRGDSDYWLREYVYLWNLLEEVSREVCPVQVIDDSSPYPDVMDHYRKLMKKGLKSPRNEFGRGGKDLATALFLYDDDGIQYYWHGRGKLEEFLEKAIQEGRSCLAQFL